MIQSKQFAIVNRKPQINRSILQWYQHHQRKLPWRNTHNAYRVLVSEIMLQQTQVSRVLIKYPEFLKQFSSFASLAASTSAEVIRAWRGMGYNNRALRLRQIAITITNEFHGRLPHDIEALQSLPGIGKYTAHAVACFAFEEQVPVVDTNIRRILRRIYGSKANHIDDWQLAMLALPRRRAYDWNQALMDLGAMVCTASNPDCGHCPIQRFCTSAHKVKPIAKMKATIHVIPNRIYRGRMIEVLRNASDHHPVELHKLGKQIKKNFAASDIPWIETLALRLQRDGLVAITTKRGKTFLSFPT
jgi:A/G-specific adenine glycosylase